MNASNSLHVVLGAGPVGVAVARHLAGRGDDVRLVTRSGRGSRPDGAALVAGDVADPDDAVRVCDGAAVVYHCANPPYHRWPELHPPLMTGAIAGASASDAKLVFADNLYAYGPAGVPLTEDLPYRAAGPNGRTRARIAETLMAAHRDGRVRAAIGRASDFYGPRVHQSAVGDRVFARAVTGKPAQVLGDPDVPHAVTYVDDFAGALVTLGERDEALGGAWHVPTGEARPMREFVGLVFDELGEPPRLSVAPGWGLTLLGLVNPEIRAVREQLYQFQRSWEVDDSRFSAAFGGTPTPLREAIRSTVAWFRANR